MGDGLRIMRPSATLHATRRNDDRIAEDTAGRAERGCNGMSMILGIAGVVLLFVIVYFLMLMASPKCPHCEKSRLKYKGEDESGREVWECPECGGRVLF